MEEYKKIGSFLDGKNIFITGCTGFFGRSLLDYFLHNKIQPAKICILSRNPSLFLQTWPHYKQLNNLFFVEGDILTFQAPSESYDHILHLATPASANYNITNPIEMHEIIVQGTLRVLNFAAKANIKSMLFSSSGAAYGKQPPEISHVSEDYFGAPQTNIEGSSYGESKRIAEMLGCEYSRKYGFEFKVARCFAFTGPHLNPKGTFAIGNFIHSALTNQDICLTGDGTPLRSYLYSEDLVIWLIQILAKGKNLEIYNVGSDQDISIYDLAIKIQKTLNPKIKVFRQKEPLQNQIKSIYVPSIEKARNKLDLHVWTNLDQSILKTFNGYKSLSLVK